MNFSPQSNLTLKNLYDLYVLIFSPGFRDYEDFTQSYTEVFLHWIVLREMHRDWEIGRRGDEEMEIGTLMRRIR